MADFNREIASFIFEHIEVAVIKQRLSPRQHKGNVVFCGYADFQISIGGTPFLHLCGNAIKLIGDQVHFDPKSEAGKGENAGSFFPCWFPMTGESRAVLTEKLKRNPKIISMCEEALNQLNGNASATAAGNPFNK